MALTVAQLQEIMPHAGRRALIFIHPLNRAMALDGIDSAVRVAAFLSQIAHESGELRYVRELASGEAYEGRKDLGNTQPGDGPRFRGRGLIQVTGRHWYQRATDDLGVPFVHNPALMELPVHAARVSTWWWRVNGVNALAETLDIRRITRRVNGGYNGLESRRAYYETACRVLGVRLPPAAPRTAGA